MFGSEGVPGEGKKRERNEGGQASRAGMRASGPSDDHNCDGAHESSKRQGQWLAKIRRVGF
jgi:hypothetical protein